MPLHPPTDHNKNVQTPKNMFFLRPKKHVTDLLTQKHTVYQGCKFPTPKNPLDPPSVILQVPLPLGFWVAKEIVD